MKKNRTRIILLVVVVSAVLLALLYFILYPKPAPTHPGGLKVPVGAGRTPTSSTFAFGTASMGCAGMGMCTAASAAADSGVLVTFWGPTEGSPNSILMTFSKNQLAQRQPGQVPFFQPQGSYMFMMPYSISKDNPIFERWGLPSGTVISSFSQSFVSIVDDTTVLDSIIYSVSQPKTAFITFGDTMNGQPDFNASGIFSISDAGGGNAVPVTIFLGSPNAAQIILKYNFNSLGSVSGNQKRFYPVPGTCQGGCRGSYLITKNYRLNLTFPNNLFLPANAMIAAGTRGRFLVGFDGFITDTVDYTLAPAGSDGMVTPGAH